MKQCIGEKINNLYKVYVVALPQEQEAYIKVSVIPVLCINGTFYYNDNTAEVMDDYKTIQEVLTPEWARRFIPGYKEEMKLSIVYAFSDYYFKCDAEKANEKLHDKLETMTCRQFYQSKW